MKKQLSSIFKDTFKSVNNISDLVTKLAILIFIYLTLNIIKDVTSSGWSGDVHILGKDDNGNFQTISVKAKKTIPPLPQRDMSYVVGLGVDTKMNKEILVGKKVLSPGNIDIYATGSVLLDHKNNLGGSVKVLMTF